MNDPLLAVVPLTCLVLLLAIGVPIAISLMSAGTLGLWMAIGMGPANGAVASIAFSESAHYTLSTVPMFMLMAEFLTNGRLSSQLFAALARWLAPIRGGMGVSVIAGNGIFGAMSGSSVAAAALHGRVAVPEMRRFGYSERLALGSVATAGTLSILIPPSIALILYGIAAEQSIGRLFAAALIPGIVTAFGYIALIGVWVRLAPDSAPPADRAPWRELLAVTRPALPLIPLIAFVLYALYSGLATPTEAGALGAGASMLLSVIFGGMRWEGIKRALAATATISAMILVVVVGAMVFTRYLAISGVTRSLIETVLDWDVNRWVVLLMILFAYLLCGLVMDQIAVLLMTVPITFPLVMELGFDPIWFGILITMTVEIGMVTPPLGLNVLVAHSVAGGDLADAFKGALTFLVVPVTILALAVAMPDVITGLGGWVYGGD